MLFLNKTRICIITYCQLTTIEIYNIWYTLISKFTYLSVWTDLIATHVDASWNDHWNSSRNILSLVDIPLISHSNFLWAKHNNTNYSLFLLQLCLYCCQMCFNNVIFDHRVSFLCLCRGLLCVNAHTPSALRNPFMSYLNYTPCLLF